MKSHIIPKMFYNEIKTNSPIKNTRIRSGHEPNRPMQDGLKLPFLCSHCESALSKYETNFSINFMTPPHIESTLKYDTDSDDLRFFLLSLAWRVMQNDAENGIKEETNGGLSSNELDKITRITELWRKLLHNKDHQQIEEIKMHLIPTKKLCICCDDDSHYISNRVGWSIRAFGEMDSFEFACVFIQTPSYFFLTTLWGETIELNDFEVGKIITQADYQLPDFILGLLGEAQRKFSLANAQLSKQQRDSIIKRASSLDQTN